MTLIQNTTSTLVISLTLIILIPMRHMLNHSIKVEHNYLHRI